MGRKRKRKFDVDIIGTLIFILLLAMFLKTTLLKDFNPDIHINLTNPFQKEKIQVKERSTTEVHSVDNTKTILTERIYVDVFFTKTDGTQDVYVAISRKKPTTCPYTTLEYAVRELIKGPSKYEQTHGIYSEIPPTTKIISVKEYPNKFNINLSSDFEFGGGGESLYKRVYQLIKTVNHNTRKPVYLYIDGKKVTVLGGEGLMIKQPLRSDSLDE